MREYHLKIRLISDTTFGRGEGLAGVVDIEVQHDELGLPYLSGRALKGLLSGECEELVFALERGIPSQAERWNRAADRLFGIKGARLEGTAILRIGPAGFPEDLRRVLAEELDRQSTTAHEILETVTTVRYQTAVDESGAPKKETLRSQRVILHGITFTAPLTFEEEPTEDDLALLSATVRAFRRAGTGRNRGHGRIAAELHTPDGSPVTEAYLASFKKAVAA